MFIDVRIPWEPGKKLGYAINRTMETVRGNVLILDHDVFLSLNPHWYQICENAIEVLKNEQWGWISCYTNAIGCPTQKLKTAGNAGADLDWHFKAAEEIYKQNKGKIEDITEVSRRWKLSGFFILTNKEAYSKVKALSGFPDNKFLGWDNYFSDRLIEHGFKLYLMQDLYVYHGYKRLWKNEMWGKGIVGNE